MPAIRVVDFATLGAEQLAEAARILSEALPGPTAYKAPGEAEAEVGKVRDDPDRFGFAALEGEVLVGWIGAIRAYSHSLELHPLVVNPPRQRAGLGTVLMAALVARAKAEGFLAIHLGADDDFGGTSLFGRDLFPHVMDKTAEIVAGARHPLEFYRRRGFEVVGLIPDANGPGRPDILMSRRIG